MAKPTDYVSVTENSSLATSDVKGVQLVEAGTGLLKGPHFNVTVSAVATTDVITQSNALSLLLGETEGFRAAPGHEFVVAQIDTNSDRPPPWDPAGATIAANLVLDGTPQPFTLPGDYDSFSKTYFVTSTVVVVSVPKDGPVLLQVTDEGITQSFDLRAGTRGEDAVPQYYAGHVQATATADYPASGTVIVNPLGVSVERPYTVAFDFGDGVGASLEPWVPGDGWAAPGSAWLIFGGFSVSSDGFQNDVAAGQPPITFALDFPATFTLTMPDGTAIPAQPGGVANVETDVTGLSTPGEAYSVRFPVVETFDVGTLTVLPAGAITASFMEGDFPASWAQTPAPLTIPIDLA